MSTSISSMDPEEMSQDMVDWIDQHYNRPQSMPPSMSYPNPGPLDGDMRYPGHGLPPRAGENRPGLSRWGRLAKGQPLGKKTVLVYNANNASRKQPALVPILRVNGDDLDALTLCVTLAPPLVIPLPFVSELLREPQNLTGEICNLEDTGNFPGLSSPVEWPPFEIVIEYGIGGTSVKKSVDFINGARIPDLSASWLQVYAVSPGGSALTGTSAAYVLYAFVGPCTGLGNAQRTIWIGPVDSLAESDVTPVPRFANNVYVVGADGGATPQITNATIRFWQDRARTSCVGNYIVTGNQPLPFPIPNGAMYASVVNQTAVATKLGILYHLS